MKFIKGMIMGTIISAGVVMMYNESMNNSKKKMVKMGKQMVKKLGII